MNTSLVYFSHIVFLLQHVGKHFRREDPVKKKKKKRKEEVPWLFKRETLHELVKWGENKF